MSFRGENPEFKDAGLRVSDSNRSACLKGSPQEDGPAWADGTKEDPEGVEIESALGPMNLTLASTIARRLREGLRIGLIEGRVYV